jgi:hypothetical protein
MERSFVRKVAVASLLVALFLAFSLPPGLYELGLLNIGGRPDPPANTGNVAADMAYLQQVFGSREPIAVRVLNPWTYAALFALDDKDLNADDGIILNWFVARKYNFSHTKNRGILFWHLSGAALAIWVSRNWTEEQIVTAAAAVTRSRPKPNFIARSGP